MKKLLLTTAMLLALSAPASAHTSVNQTFTCVGTFSKDEIAAPGDYEHDYPMLCYLDDAAIKKVAAVCRQGEACIVHAKGESGNGNRHLVQKVLSVHQQTPDIKVKELPKEMQGTWCSHDGGQGTSSFDRCQKIRDSNDIVVSGTTITFPTDGSKCKLSQLSRDIESFLFFADARCNTEGRPAGTIKMRFSIDADKRLVWKE
jgi:hypothetical protein